MLNYVYRILLKVLMDEMVHIQQNIILQHVFLIQWKQNHFEIDVNLVLLWIQKKIIFLLIFFII